VAALLAPHPAEYPRGKLQTLYGWQGTCERTLAWYDALRRFNQTWTDMVEVFEPVMCGEKTGLFPRGRKRLHHLNVASTHGRDASALAFRQRGHETALLARYGRRQTWPHDRLLRAEECCRAGM
jgi:hypothetical protein